MRSVWKEKSRCPSDWLVGAEGIGKDEAIAWHEVGPFGYAEVRQLERELRDEYERTVLTLAEAAGSAAELDSVYQLAVAADDVRGYEDLKLSSGRELLEKLAQSRRSWVAGVNLKDKVATPSL